MIFLFQPPQPSPPQQEPPEPPSDEERTEAWVTERYLKLGFTLQATEAFVADKVCWHDAKHLLDAGCSHELVVAILL